MEVKFDEILTNNLHEAISLLNGVVGCYNEIRINKIIEAKTILESTLEILCLANKD